MNDRFKFRAWNIIVNRYEYFDFHSLAKMDYDKIQWHILKFEQCTGLKDKNGRLIYEGDILENNVLKSPVEWFNGGFWINGFTNGVKWNIHFVHDTSTVVGNIHENPELLEDK